MNKKSLYKVVMASAATLILTNSANAQTGSLYFMEWNPQQHQLNPAFQPKGKFYIGVPALSYLNFRAGNNDLVFTDIFQNIKVDGKKQTVLFFDEKAKNGSIDNYLDALSDGTHIFYDHRINLIDFGFKAGKGYVTFDIANRANVNLRVPKAISQLAFEGIDEGETFHLDGKNLATDATLYTEFALGYSRPVNDKLTVGGKVKFLYGHANVRTNFKNINITGNEDYWRIEGDGSIEGAVPGITLIEKEDGRIDDVEFDEDIETSEYAKPRGKGFAVDLGATYKVLPELTVSASVLDLGFIHWSKDIHRVKKVSDFVWDGIEYEIGDDTTDYGAEYEDMANAMFRVDHNAESYTSWLNTKFMLGGEYTMWNDRLGFGLLGRGQLFKGKFYGNGLASVNFRPWRQLSASVTYGLFDGEWNNLGAGLNLNAGPINLFCAAENIPFKFAKSEGTLIPSNTRNAQVSLGMNLYFGYSPKKEKKAKEKDDIVKKTEEPVLVDNTEKKKDNNSGNQELAEQDKIVENVNKQENEIAKTEVTGTDTTANSQIAEETKPENKEVPASIKALADGAVYGIKFLNYKDHYMAIDPKSYPLLDKIADQMKATPDMHMTVVCHTAFVKDSAFTYWLTAERANLIRGYMVEKEIDYSRIDIISMGADKPIAKGNTEADRQKNTRTVLIFER